MGAIPDAWTGALGLSSAAFSPPQEATVELLLSKAEDANAALLTCNKEGLNVFHLSLLVCACLVPACTSASSHIDSQLERLSALLPGAQWANDV